MARKPNQQTNFMKTFFMAVIGVVASLYVNAQQLADEPAGGDEDSLIEAPANMVLSSMLPSELNFSPLKDWYPTWDNQYVRLYHGNYSYKGDSVNLDLVNDDYGYFVPPVKGQLLSPFGYRGKRIHSGVDLRLNLYDTVVAAFSGVVRMARYFSGYGNCVVIRHFNGLETLYGHLSKISVNVNQKVYAGELIGLGGSTGRATCNHLHFETRFMGDAFNPKQLIDFDNYSLTTDHFTISPSVFGRTRDYMPACLRESAVKDLTIAGQEPDTPKAVSKAKPKYHTIRNGDTLYAIANRNGTTVKKLCSLNGIKQNKVLKPGTRLKVR